MALARDARGDEDAAAGPPRRARAARSASSSVGQRVGLVQADQLGPLEQARRRSSPTSRRTVRQASATSSPVPSTRWISTRQRSMWPRKRSPEPGALVRALDQPRQVGDDEAVVADLDRAELGLERGERVVGDLRPGARDAREEGRLAGVRQADQAGVREQLEAQPDPALLARRARRRAARRLVGRGLEAAVAEAAAAALGDHHGLARRQDLGQHGRRGRRRGSPCRAAAPARHPRRSRRCGRLPMPWPPRGARKCCL